MHMHLIIFYFQNFAIYVQPSLIEVAYECYDHE